MTDDRDIILLRIGEIFLKGRNRPQFFARFDKYVLLNDLDTPVLKEILLHSYDSPFVRSQRFFRVMGIDLEIEDLAAALVAERAAQDTRTGARSLRPVFSDIINPIEFDPWHHEALEESGEEGRKRLAITSGMVKEVLEKV